MAKTRKKVTVKKKNWVTILTPENKELGECYIEEPEKIVGRRIKSNLMNLMNDPRKRKYNLSFQITDYDSNTAKTRVIGFETQPTSIKMMIRKGNDRVDYRLIAKTSNDEELIIKPLIITRGNVTASLRTAIRKMFDKELKKYAKKQTTDKMFEHIVTQKLQKQIKKPLSKLYPIKSIEIKKAILKQ